MTLPPESDEQKVEAQHICRPVIHSYISQGSYAAELQNKIVELEDTIADMNQEKEDIIRQLQYHTSDTETLKQELRLKEELVSQLEQEFTSLEELVAHLQQVRWWWIESITDRSSKPKNLSFYPFFFFHFTQLPNPVSSVSDIILDSPFSVLF